MLLKAGFKIVFKLVFYFIYWKKVVIGNNVLYEKEFCRRGLLLIHAALFEFLKPDRRFENQ